jgi:hypothetical protein
VGRGWEEGGQKVAEGGQRVAKSGQRVGRCGGSVRGDVVTQLWGCGGGPLTNRQLFNKRSIDLQKPKLFAGPFILLYKDTRK